MKDFVSGGRFGTSALVASLALVGVVAGSAFLPGGAPALALAGMLLVSVAMFQLSDILPRTLVHAADASVVGAVPSVGPEAKRGGRPAWPTWGCGLSVGRGL